MSLKDLVIPSETILIPNNEPIVVRGLGLDSIVYLLRHHRTSAEELFQRAQDGSLDASSIEELAVTMIDQFASLAAMIISCGAGEPDEWPTAQKLPASVQIDAIVKIGSLTLIAEGGVEKMMETVIKVMAGVAGLNLPSQLTDGFGT